ncbi:MAG TPA: hypothetical protein VMN57_05230, partial [Anaerolineales bacterium]|nr:hypothetical protein [Anaerolineales bacterium]
MKTQILPIEPHDDVHSVRDRMAWGKSARILLVWPDNGPGVLDRRLDLLLLKRRAAELGSQIAAVTGDPEVRFHAGELGVPVFGSTAEAQASTWLRRGEPGPLPDPELGDVRSDPRGARPPRPGGGSGGTAGRLAALAAAVLAVLAITAAVLPSAVIRVEPEAREQRVAFTAVTGPSVTDATASGSVPVTVLTAVVEGRHAVETTGSVLVPSGSAGGEVVFTNLTAETVTVPEGAVVLTGGEAAARFVVTAGGTVPAGPGQAMTLTVTAALPGAAGDAAAGAVTAVEGLLGLQVTVSNPAPLTGGSDVRLAAPSDSDRERASRELLEALGRTAAEELAARVGPGDAVLTAEPRLAATEQESFIPAEAVPADVVEATLRVEFRILVITASDLEDLAAAVLDAG